MDFQESIIESIRTIAGEKLKNVNFTKSYTGIVRSVDGLNCIVEIFGSDSECIIPQNLSSFVEKDDIVIIQDIANNRFKRIVQGVISSLNKDMFHIYDPIEDKIISSIMQLWDEELQEPVDIVFELE